MSIVAELVVGTIEAIGRLLGREAARKPRVEVDRVPTRYELEEESRVHERLEQLAIKKRRSER